VLVGVSDYAADPGQRGKFFRNPLRITSGYDDLRPRVRAAEPAYG